MDRSSKLSTHIELLYCSNIVSRYVAKKTARVTEPATAPGGQDGRGKSAHLRPNSKKSWGEFTHSVRGRLPGAREALQSRTFATDIYVTRRKNPVTGFEIGQVSSERHLAEVEWVFGPFFAYFPGVLQTC
jgi:hypothetical protein